MAFQLGNQTPEYRCWQQMKDRCYNPTNARYKDYGARGISVDPNWLHSFLVFYGEMGPKPGPGYSLERKDNNGNYDPDNWQMGYSKRASCKPAQRRISKT